MCVYCMMADWIHRYVPDPVQPWSPPMTPAPYQPVHPPGVPYPNGPLVPIGPNPFAQPWTQEQMDEIVKILALVKEMEDALGGCPCEEPQKMDFLKDIQTRLDSMKEQIKVLKDERAETATSTDPITSG